MGGVRPPRDWLQKQKRRFAVKIVLINLAFLCAFIAFAYWFLDLARFQ